MRKYDAETWANEGIKVSKDYTEGDISFESSYKQKCFFIKETDTFGHIFV